MKRAISLFFIFLMISGIFMVAVPGAIAEDKKEHILMLYDAKGRLLNTDLNSALDKFLKTAVYERRYILGVPVGWKKIAEGSNLFTFKSSGEIKIVSYWFREKLFDGVVIPDSYEVKVEASSVPAIPIGIYKIEPVQVSGDLHEVNTKYYNVKFGQGEKGNEIVITIAGTDVYRIPVNLSIGDGSNNEVKPFRFLAQNPNGVVKGEDKFLIWTTAVYFSAVRTVKIGQGGSVLIVWTYGYSEIWKDWITKVITATVAGALIGAAGGGGVGAVVGATAGALASAVAWAVKPELAGIDKSMAVGVVAALFTPRYFIIQGTSGLGANSTKGTVVIGGLPESNYEKISDNMGTFYSIYTTSNEIQMGAVKYWSGGISETYIDFEDGQSHGFEGGQVITQSGTYKDDYIHDGAYAYYCEATDPNHRVYYNVSVATEYSITLNFWVTFQVRYSKVEAVFYDKDGNEIQSTTLIYDSALTSQGGSIVSKTLHAPEGATKLSIQFYYTKTDTTGRVGIDDFHIKIADENNIIHVFRDEATIPYIRLSFGTIPTIAPTLGNGVTIQSRDNLIMIDMPKDTGLGIDWASPCPMVIPSTIVIKSDTWAMNGLLLATDNIYGFLNTTFVLGYPDNWLYRVEYEQYNLFSTFTNWTVIPNWTPFIANNTTVYVPNFEAFNNPLAGWQYNIQGWWEDIGTWGHLALMGLGLLIIFIILLILAPQIIILLIKLIAWIIRGIIKGIGQIGKAFKGKRRG